MGAFDHAAAQPTLAPLRVIDHVGNSGGGIKYVARLLGELSRQWRVELNAQPVALERYRRALPAGAVALRPAWPTTPASLLADHSPLLGTALAVMGRSDLGWTFGVRAPEPGDRTVHFFPWLHRHSLAEFQGRGIGVFHDAIFFTMPDIVGERIVERERANLRTWFDKLDVVVVTSQYTRGRLLAVAGQPLADRIAVIPVADSDGGAVEGAGGAATRRFGRFLFMPANTVRHKNHRVLLQAMKRSIGTWNLVLTGEGTGDGPGSAIGQLIRESGMNGRVFGLGYVKRELVAQLIQDAEALVMPTLAEGGGSFPVCEAITAGTPVLASGIDVIREQLQRMNAEAALFDATSVDALVALLDGLAREPEAFRARARAQLPRLRLRAWADVAADFSRLLAERFPGC